MNNFNCKLTILIESTTENFCNLIFFCLKRKFIIVSKFLDINGLAKFKDQLINYIGQNGGNYSPYIPPTKFKISKDMTQKEAYQIMKEAGIVEGDYYTADASGRVLNDGIESGVKDSYGSINTSRSGNGFSCFEYDPSKVSMNIPLVANFLCTLPIDDEIFIGITGDLPTTSPVYENTKAYICKTSNVEFLSEKGELGHYGEVPISADVWTPVLYNLRKETHSGDGGKTADYYPQCWAIVIDGKLITVDASGNMKLFSINKETLSLVDEGAISLGTDFWLHGPTYLGLYFHKLEKEPAKTVTRNRLVAFGGHTEGSGSSSSSSSSYACIAYSEDNGITWTKSRTFEKAGAAPVLVAGDNKFVYYSADTEISYSLDGINWVKTAQDIIDDGTPKLNYKAAAYGNNGFVAFYYKMSSTDLSSAVYTGITVPLHSLDGITWEKGQEITIKSMLMDIVYGGDKYVAVGAPMDKVESSVAQDAQICYSLDGLAWTPINLKEQFLNFKEIYLGAVAYGNNKYIAVGCYGLSTDELTHPLVIYSTDGINWVESTPGIFKSGDGLGDTASVCAAAYGNDKFIVGTFDGTMAYSNDGITWTKINHSEIELNFYIFYSQRAITYAENKFTLIDINGVMAYSDDGITWTKIEQNIFNETYFNSIASTNIEVVIPAQEGGWEVPVWDNTDKKNEFKHWRVLKTKDLKAYESVESIELTEDLLLADIVRCNGRIFARGITRTANESDVTTYTATYAFYEYLPNTKTLKIIPNEYNKLTISNDTIRYLTPLIVKDNVIYGTISGHDFFSYNTITNEFKDLGNEIFKPQIIYVDQGLYSGGFGIKYIAQSFTAAPKRFNITETSTADSTTTTIVKYGSSNSWDSFTIDMCEWSDALNGIIIGSTTVIYPIFATILYDPSQGKSKVISPHWCGEVSSDVNKIRTYIPSPYAEKDGNYLISLPSTDSSSSCAILFASSVDITNSLNFEYGNPTQEEVVASYNKNSGDFSKICTDLIHYPYGENYQGPISAWSRNISQACQTFFKSDMSMFAGVGLTDGERMYRFDDATIKFNCPFPLSSIDKMRVRDKGDAYEILLSKPLNSYCWSDSYGHYFFISSNNIFRTYANMITILPNANMLPILTIKKDSNETVGATFYWDFPAQLTTPELSGARMVVTSNIYKDTVKSAG